MRADVEELVTTLLWEGYALYPYTPGATKNATPTPFGIVYPPAYAEGSPTTFDRIRLQAIVEGPGDAELTLTVLFLQSSGERHEAVARRIELPPRTIASLASEPERSPFDLDGVTGRVRLESQRFDDTLARVTMCVHNFTEVPAGLDRAEALRSSLLSTHVVAEVSGGARFLSPVDPPEHAAAAVMACAAVNSFPVLAADDDTVLLGAAIVLPDHPQLAPESRGDLFDATEIEEALLLHVLALSDGEREEIAGSDPAVRAMIERAVAATPRDIVNLHGRVTVRDPVALPPNGNGTAGRGEAGESEATVDGITYRPGARVRLHVGTGTAQDHLLDGRTATVERIYVDYDDAVHLGVTLDDDPGRELMRDIGRYLYFKPADVEVI